MTEKIKSRLDEITDEYKRALDRAKQAPEVLNSVIEELATHVTKTVSPDYYRAATLGTQVAIVHEQYTAIIQYLHTAHSYNEAQEKDYAFRNRGINRPQIKQENKT